MKTRFRLVMDTAVGRTVIEIHLRGDETSEEAVSALRNAWNVARNVLDEEREKVFTSHH